MKNLIFLVLISITLITCDKDNKTEHLTSCGLQDPLTELEWLAQMAEPCEENEQIGFSIHQAVYRNVQTVFFRNIVCAACNVAFNVTLLNCEGEVIKVYQEGDQNMFEEEIDSVETIYNCYDN